MNNDPNLATRLGSISQSNLNNNDISHCGPALRWSALRNNVILSELQKFACLQNVKFEL